MTAMRVQGLIQAAGTGTRLGLGPKAFVELGGLTLLERAVHLLSGLVDDMIVAVPPDAVARAASLVGDCAVRIIAGAGSRSETTWRLISEASAPWLVLHDVVHPFATPELVKQLLERARQGGAAAPGLRNTEFIYDRSGEPLHAPGDVLVGQKPVVFSRSAVLAGYAALPPEGAGSDPSLMQILERGGVRTAFTEGSAVNIKITAPEDLRLARALLAVGDDDAQAGVGR